MSKLKAFLTWSARIAVGITVACFLLVSVIWLYFKVADPDFRNKFRYEFIAFGDLVRGSLYTHKNWGEFSQNAQKASKESAELLTRVQKLDPGNQKHRDEWRMLLSAIEQYQQIMKTRCDYFDYCTQLIDCTDEDFVDPYSQCSISRSRKQETDSTQGSLDSMFAVRWGELIVVGNDYNVVLPELKHNTVAGLESWNTIVERARKAIKPKPVEHTPKKVRGSLPTLNIGDSMGQVRDLFGNPSSIESYESLGEEVWRYDKYINGIYVNGSLTFKNGWLHESSGIEVDPLIR